MPKESFSEVVDAVRNKDPRYAKAAYYFLRAALDHTLKTMAPEVRTPESHHVSGQQLLEGIRSYALDQFGPMAYTVLTEWGLKESRDFGNLVFNLVEIGVLGKTDTDRIEDFENGFDFKGALLLPFEPRGNLPDFSSKKT
jgi:uncharacterized repeat protein (TIGR04138 family)